MKGFYIVDFLSTGESDLAPGRWLLKRNNKLFCYWPPKGTKDISQKVKKGNLTSPPPSWGECEVSVVKNMVFEKYDTGRKKLAMIEKSNNTSDLNSEVENLSRKAKRQRHFNDELTSRGETGIIPIPPSLTGASSKIVRTRTLSTSSSDRMSMSTNSLSSASNSDLPNIISSKVPIVDPTPPPQLMTRKTTEPAQCCQHNSDWQKQIERKLAIILGNQGDILEMLHNLGSRPTAINQEESCDLNELFSSFPLQTGDELKSLEDWLDDASIKKKLITFLKQQGGHSPGDAVRRLMRVLFTDELAATFTWKGSTGKPKMGSLKVISAMFSAIKKMPGMSETTNKVLEDSAKDWLRRASDRLRVRAKSRSLAQVPDIVDSE